MKNFLAIFVTLLTFLALPALADNFVTVPHPTAVWDSTTGKAYALGIPGQGQTGLTILPSAATTNTWSGTNNFTGAFQIGGTAQTFPGSGLLVGTTDTQTLSAKTLTSPIITGPVPVACGATCTLGNGNIRATTLLNQAAGSTVTLPGATGTGNIYRLMISVATTSAAEKVLTNPTTDTIIGTAIGENGGTAKIFVGNASTYHSIQMPFAGTQPSGGFIGDSVVCTDVATAIWQCNIQYQGGATPTTPYSASTT